MVKEITSTEAIQLIEANKAILIDVREQDEFDAEHISSATLIQLSTFAQEFEKFDVPNDKQIIFQCRSGGRSFKACEFVENNNLCSNTCYNLIGGIVAWKKEGYETIT